MMFNAVPGCFPIFFDEAGNLWGGGLDGAVVSAVHGTLSTIGDLRMNLE